MDDIIEIEKEKFEKGNKRYLEIKNKVYETPSFTYSDMKPGLKGENGFFDRLFK